MGIIDLKSYMGSPLQVSRVALASNNNINFHWSDYSKACEVYQSYFKSNKFGLYDKLLYNLDVMADTAMWIKENQHIYTFSLFQIYECLIFNKKLTGLNKGKEDAVELSLIGPSGPFKKGYLSECINDEKYAKFIFQYLFSDQLKFRDFRIHCHGEILCYYDKLLTRSFILGVEQITADGILFKNRDKNLKKKLKSVSEIRPLIDIRIFENAIGKSLNDIGHNFSNHSKTLFFTYDDRCEYKVKTEKLKFFLSHNSKETGVDYLFCRFEDIQGHNSLFHLILKSFIDNMREQIDEEIPKAG